MNRILLTLTVFSLALTATAQAPKATRAITKLSAPTAAVDFDGAMKKTKLKFEKDTDGDYKLEVSWTKEKRSQIVFVRGKAADVQGEKMREVWSICWKGDTRPSAEVLEKLLTTRYKAGAFQLEKSEEGKYFAYFRIDLPEDVKAPLLDKVINMVGEVSDDMEKELTGDADDL